MVHGHSRDQWTRLSVLLAVLVNLQRDPESKPITPGQMDIYNTRGELKKPQTKKRTSLSDIMKITGTKHEQQREKNGPDPQSDENHRPQ